MSKSLRYTFLLHAVVALLFGAALFVAPGRFLGLFGWAPVDALLSRVLGAALLALGWGSYRGFRAAERGQVALLVELEAIFCVLAAAGLARQMLGYAYPWYVWTMLGVYVLFAIAWVWALLKK
jgi:hypothetical protein